MKINNITLYNFRNYENISVDFSEKINIFIGSNGSGKTNLLESIYFLALTRSHRSYIDKNLINNNKSNMKVVGKISTFDKIKKLEILMNSKGKMVSINNVPIRKVSEYISNFTVLLFCADDMEIIKGSPSERRKYLNLEIGQLDNKYFNHLNEYNKILKERNEYLRTIKIEKNEDKFLEVLNIQLVEKAILLYRYRYSFIYKLTKNLRKIYNYINDGKIEIKYKNSIDIEEYDEYKIKTILLEKLSKNVKKEIFQGNTLYGPHKDDFEILIDKKNLREYGSQGQQRLAVLCLKISELDIFKESKGEYPVLLLDDVFSELDIGKRNKIVSLLNKELQVFITSTDVNNIDKTIIKNSKVYNINEGAIF